MTANSNAFFDRADEDFAALEIQMRIPARERTRWNPPFDHLPRPAGILRHSAEACVESIPDPKDRARGSFALDVLRTHEDALFHMKRMALSQIIDYSAPSNRTEAVERALSVQRLLSEIAAHSGKSLELRNLFALHLVGLICSRVLSCSPEKQRGQRDLPLRCRIVIEAERHVADACYQISVIYDEYVFTADAMARRAMKRLNSFSHKNRTSVNIVAAGAMSFCYAQCDQEAESMKSYMCELLRHYGDDDRRKGES